MTARWLLHAVLENEHCVAVTVEPVFSLDRMAIGVENQIVSRQRGHEHQKRRARQVEVRDQPTHHTKLKSGIDEQIRSPRAGSYTPLPVCRFERASGSCADRDYAP